jgi:ribosomal protein S12 methylthiotransferase accessory factor
MPSKEKNRFSEVKTYFHEDILDDIRFVKSRLAAVGLGRAIIVDLTNPELSVPVVRAVVPGLETFKITKSVMGRRAKECFGQWQDR